jgi:ATP-dependent DNA helicase RecQ
MNVLKAYAAENKLESRIQLKTPKRERALRAEKPAASNTQRVTFELFQEGYDMADIASKRGLSLNTIEGHLAAFIATGELSATKLVAKEKLDTILALIRQTGQTHAAKPIKDLLPEEYTYGEIRIAQGHYEWMKHA